METEYKFIHFELAKQQNPNSWIYNCYSNEDEYLGQVKYYARWRQYAYYPTVGTVYEKTCLTDIAEFCRALSVRQRAGIKPQKTLTQESQS